MGNRKNAIAKERERSFCNGVFWLGQSNKKSDTAQGALRRQTSALFGIDVGPICFIANKLMSDF